MEHTKTPWKASENDWYIIGDSGHICEIVGPHGYEEKKANARRICAAVNFCGNEPIENLEDNDLKGLLNRGEEKIKSMRKQITQLQAKNAWLLEALKIVCDEFDADENTRSEAEVIAAARSALAEPTE